MTNNSELKTMLQLGLVCVRFRRVDGEERLMTCTTNGTYIPAESKPASESTRKLNEEVQRVWDVNAKAWRSFRYDNVITASLVD